MRRGKGGASVLSMRQKLRRVGVFLNKKYIIFFQSLFILGRQRSSSKRVLVLIPLGLRALIGGQNCTVPTSPHRRTRDNLCLRIPALQCTARNLRNYFFCSLYWPAIVNSNSTQNPWALEFRFLQRKTAACTSYARTHFALPSLISSIVSLGRGLSWPLFLRGQFVPVAKARGHFCNAHSTSHAYACACTSHPRNPCSV